MIWGYLYFWKPIYNIHTCLYIYIWNILNKFEVNLCPVNNCFISIWIRNPQILGFLNSAGRWTSDLVHWCHDVDSKKLVQKERKIWVGWWLVIGQFGWSFLLTQKVMVIGCNISTKGWWVVNWNVFCSFVLILLEHVRVWKRFPVTICQTGSLNNELEESANSKMAPSCSTTVFWSFCKPWIVIPFHSPFRVSWR